MEMSGICTIGGGAAGLGADGLLGGIGMMGGDATIGDGGALWRRGGAAPITSVPAPSGSVPIFSGK